MRNQGTLGHHIMIFLRVSSEMWTIRSNPLHKICGPSAAYVHKGRRDAVIDHNQTVSTGYCWIIHFQLKRDEKKLGFAIMKYKRKLLRWFPIIWEKVSRSNDLLRNFPPSAELPFDQIIFIFVSETNNSQFRSSKPGGGFSQDMIARPLDGLIFVSTLKSSIGTAVMRGL